MGGNSPYSAVISNYGASQGSNRPDRDAVGVSNGLNLCFRRNFEHRTKTKVLVETDMGRRDVTSCPTSPATMELGKHSRYRKTILLMKLDWVCLGEHYQSNGCNKI